MLIGSLLRRDDGEHHSPHRLVIVTVSTYISYYYSISEICTWKRERKKLKYFVQSRRQLCVRCCVCIYWAPLHCHRATQFISMRRFTTFNYSLVCRSHLLLLLPLPFCCCCVLPLFFSHLIYVCSFKRFLSTHKEQTHSGRHTQSLHFCVNCSHRRRWLALHNHSRVVIHSLLCCCCECVHCRRVHLLLLLMLLCQKHIASWLYRLNGVCMHLPEKRAPENESCWMEEQWQSLCVFAAVVAAAFAPY